MNEFELLTRIESQTGKFTTADGNLDVILAHLLMLYKWEYFNLLEEPTYEVDPARGARTIVAVEAKELLPNGKSRLAALRAANGAIGRDAGQRA